MSETFTTPVLFLVFNRADLTRRVFQRIRDIRPALLFVAADGPRLGRDSDRLACEEVRLALADIDWPCTVRRLYRKQNLGCKIAVSSAISWFFEHVEEGIILEDDCLPDPTFFPFCAQLLDRYRDKPDVALISGNQMLPSKHMPRQATSYYFSKYPNIWGWATWRRAWRHYDVSLSGWDGNSKDLKGISNPRVRRRFGRRFDAVKAGCNDTWDYQLFHQCLQSNGLCVSPVVNLVKNIGFDERATHTLEPVYSEAPGVRAMSFPMVHPERISCDEKTDKRTEARVYRVPANLWVSLWWSLAKRYTKLLIWLRSLLGM
jgi:hypothetical protein